MSILHTSPGQRGGGGSGSWHRMQRCRRSRSSTRATKSASSSSVVNAPHQPSAWPPTHGDAGRRRAVGGAPGLPCRSEAVALSGLPPRPRQLPRSRQTVQFVEYRERSKCSITSRCPGAVLPPVYGGLGRADVACELRLRDLMPFAGRLGFTAGVCVSHACQASRPAHGCRWNHQGPTIDP